MNKLSCDVHTLCGLTNKPPGTPMMAVFSFCCVIVRRSMLLKVPLFEPRSLELADLHAQLLPTASHLHLV